MASVDSYKLKNGLRIVYAHHPNTTVTHCALMVKAGTRDEDRGKEGLAHFIEHALFKGTSKRKSYHILNMSRQLCMFVTMKHVIREYLRID